VSNPDLTHDAPAFSGSLTRTADSWRLYLGMGAGEPPIPNALGIGAGEPPIPIAFGIGAGEPPMAKACRKLELASTTSTASSNAKTKFFIAFLQGMSSSRTTRNWEERVKNYLREVNSLFVLFPPLHSARTETKVKRNCLRFMVLEQKAHALGCPLTAPTTPCTFGVNRPLFVPVSGPPWKPPPILPPDPLPVGSMALGFSSSPVDLTGGE